MPAASGSDKTYVLDLCDAVLGQPGSRQHRFKWLQSDVSPKTGHTVCLPVSGFWESQDVIVEFRAHGRDTRYDSRRDELIPQRGIRHIVITPGDFETRGGKIVRQESDFDVVSARLKS